MSWATWGADNSGRESERVAGEADERERFTSRTWLTIDEDYLLRQAYAGLYPTDRQSRSIRDRALAVITKLGNPDVDVDGTPLREHEPALIVAVALELARRWRATAGDTEEVRDMRKARARYHSWLASAIDDLRPSPEYVTMSEVAKLVGDTVRQALAGKLPSVKRGTFRYVSLVDVERALAARRQPPHEAIERVRAAIVAARSQTNSADDGAHGAQGDPATGCDAPLETLATVGPVFVDMHAHGCPRDAGTGASSPAETGVRVDPFSEEVA